MFTVGTPKRVETMMIYTHILNKGGRGINSPLDSAQFDSGATLKIRDRLRSGAMYADPAGEANTGTTN